MTTLRGHRGSPSTIPEHCFTLSTHRVCVVETDMMGIVHHGTYVNYFERGRLDYLRQRGYPYKRLIDRGYHMPVVELNARYKKSAHFDDLLQIKTRLAAVTRVTVKFEYAISRLQEDSGEPSDLLLEGHILLACIDAGGRPRPLPDDVVRVLFLPASEDDGALL